MDVEVPVTASEAIVEVTTEEVVKREEVLHAFEVEHPQPLVEIDDEKDVEMVEDGASMVELGQGMALREDVASIEMETMAMDHIETIAAKPSHSSITYAPPPSRTSTFDAPTDHFLAPSPSFSFDVPLSAAEDSVISSSSFTVLVPCPHTSATTEPAASAAPHQMATTSMSSPAPSLPYSFDAAQVVFADAGMGVEPTGEKTAQQSQRTDLGATAFTFEIRNSRTASDKKRVVKPLRTSNRAKEGSLSLSFPSVSFPPLASVNDLSLPHLPPLLPLPSLITLDEPAPLHTVPLSTEPFPVLLPKAKENINTVDGPPNNVTEVCSPFSAESRC